MNLIIGVENENGNEDLDEEGKEDEDSRHVVHILKRLN